MADQYTVAVALLKQLTELHAANKFSNAQELLVPLKMAIAQFPPAADDKVKLQQNVLAREALELSALVSVQLNQTDAFERNMAQLKQYYFDASVALPPSERHYPILGLHLLSLLAHNRIAEFHTELELIPLEAHEQNAYVRYARQLEQQYMEGSYGKVLRAAAAVPLPYYATFTQLLTTTVREKVADCCEKAYNTLPASAAAAMLFVQPAHLQEICTKRGWKIADSTITFASGGDASLEIPSHQLINDMLSYANELERIV